MKSVFVGPLTKSEKIRKLKKQLKYICYAFVICFVPLIIIFINLRSNATISGPYSVVKSVALLTHQTGSGSAILTGKTRLLTAAHVVENMKIGDVVQLNFQKAGQIQTPARVIYLAQSENLGNEYDFAVLELVDKYSLINRVPPIELGRSSMAQLSDKVIVVGYPSGNFALTSGVISDDRAENRDLFTVDAGAWAGNSGGAVINEKDEDLIGLVIAVTTGEFVGRTLAIKIDFITETLLEQGIDITQ